MVPKPLPYTSRKRTFFASDWNAYSVPTNDAKHQKLNDGSISPIHLYFGSCDCADCVRVREQMRFRNCRSTYTFRNGLFCEMKYEYEPIFIWKHEKPKHIWFNIHNIRSNWEYVNPKPNLRKRWRMYVDPVFPRFPSHPSWMHQQPLYPEPEFAYKPQKHKSPCR